MAEERPVSPGSADPTQEASAKKDPNLDPYGRLVESIRVRSGILAEYLNEMESLKLSRLSEDINLAYYMLWSRAANDAYRQMAILSKRIKRIKKGLRSN